MRTENDYIFAELWAIKTLVSQLVLYLNWYTSLYTLNVFYNRVPDTTRDIVPSPCLSRAVVIMHRQGCYMFHRSDNALNKQEEAIDHTHPTVLLYELGQPRGGFYILQAHSPIKM